MSPTGAGGAASLIGNTGATDVATGTTSATTGARPTTVVAGRSATGGHTTPDTRVPATTREGRRTPPTVTCTASTPATSSRTGHTKNASGSPFVAPTTSTGVATSSLSALGVCPRRLTCVQEGTPRRRLRLRDGRNEKVSPPRPT